MATMAQTPREIAESYWRAECSRDIDAILAHFHPDAELIAPGATLRGHGEIRGFYEDAVARFPGLEVTVGRDLSTGDEACIEWEAVMIDHEGKRHPASGANVIRVSGGKLERVRVYSG
jgi:ketosteroid isomerase-like protein